MRSSTRSLLVLITLVWSASLSYAAGAATMYLSPVSKPAEVGKTFVANITINPSGTSVDTARAQISFSSNLITAVNVSLAGSLDSPAPGNSVNNNTGTISWGGFTVDRPLTSTGLFARVTFRANAVGDAVIKVSGTSKLINNGNEVGNPGGFNQITVNVVPAGEGTSPLQITSSTHPNSDKWYQANTVQLSWNYINGASYLWSWDRDPESVPTQPTRDISKSLRNVKSGVWYFHLQARLADGKITDPISYRVQIDNVAPNPIEPYLDVNDTGQLTVRFATTDYHSGIASYDLRVNQETIENAHNPYVLRGLNIGDNLIAVTSYDIAGNVRQGWVKFVLNPDGTIRDVTTSQKEISGVAGILSNNYLIIVGIFLVLLALYLLYRRRPVVSVIPAIPGVPGNQTITKTTIGPKGAYTRTSVHTHTHSYTDADTYTDTAPDLPVPPVAEPTEPEKPSHHGLAKKHKKGSGENHKSE